MLLWLLAGFWGSCMQSWIRSPRRVAEISNASLIIHHVAGGRYVWRCPSICPPGHCFTNVRQWLLDLFLIKRISSPHRTEIRYVLTCGLLVGWQTPKKRLLFASQFNLFVIAYTTTMKKLMFFPCDLSVESKGMIGIFCVCSLHNGFATTTTRLICGKIQTCHGSKDLENVLSTSTVCTASISRLANHPKNKF